MRRREMLAMMTPLQKEKYRQRNTASPTKMAYMVLIKLAVSRNLTQLERAMCRAAAHRLKSTGGMAP